MRSLQPIKNNLLFGILLSVILTAIVIPFIKLGDRFELTTLKDVRIDPQKIFIYKDIDHDGTSEKITVIRDFGGFSAVILNKNNYTQFEWNLHGKIGNDDFLCSGDSNHDGVDEIFVFTHAHDSIFLNAFNIKNKAPLFAPLFIAKFKFLNGAVDVGVRDPRLVDLDHDGTKDLVFILFSGFTKSIRAIYKINLKNRTIQHTPKAGSSPSLQLHFSDITGNGTDEIMGPIESFGNCSLQYPLSDSLLWFCVYDNNLHYLFKPVKFGKYPGTVWISPFREKKKNLIALFVHNNHPGDSSFLAFANTKGNLLQYRRFYNAKKGQHYYFKVIHYGHKMRLALYNTDNGVVKYFNENLKLVDSYQSVPFESIIYPFDLDGDGVKEEVYFGLDMDHIVVARNDFTRPAMVKFNGEVTTFYFSENWVNGKPAALCLNLKNKYCEFKYKRNPYYTYRYLIYGAMFLLILLLVNLIGFYYQRLLKIRYRAEEKMRDLQQQAIEQQLTPHFTLNILNSIGAMYENRKTETARIYMGKYSKLLRENLLASGDITTSFQQELDFVKNYLDLEQFRYNNKFTYSISCAAVSIPVQLPRLFIYTFVENALKHGLFHIMGSQPAHIDIHCLDQEKYWKVEISDNGIGRKESSKIKSFSTGKGLEIIQETLKLYQSLKHRRITFIMEDLNPEQTYTGTKVTILIQKKTNAKKRN